MEHTKQSPKESLSRGLGIEPEQVGDYLLLVTAEVHPVGVLHSLIQRAVRGAQARVEEIIIRIA